MHQSGRPTWVFPEDQGTGRQGDQLSHKIFEELSTSFITPFDREDVHYLADCLDDVIDRVNSCAKRIAIYNPRVNNPKAYELGQVVKEDAVCIGNAMNELETLRKMPWC